MTVLNLDKSYKAAILEMGMYNLGEIDYLTDCGTSLPNIVDDAYLNFVVLPVGTLAAAQILGTIETTWG